MSTNLKSLILETMFQVISQIFKQFTNVIKSEYFFITANKIKITIVIYCNENVLNN